jgi:beta-ribofuranosylaminobenzene 5'-phosphate synthase
VGAAPSPASVTARAPARLHLGFLNPGPGPGRRLASLGLALRGLETRITVRRSSALRITGPERARVRQYAEMMGAHLGLQQDWAIDVQETVPAHAGLGSGTQLALAIASGIRRLHNLPLDCWGDAARLGRGARSAIGIGAFEHGGLILDGGHGSNTRLAPIIARLRFPSAWRIVLVLDKRRQGIHGEQETAAFAVMPSFPQTKAARHCELVLMKALPAVAESDLVSFGSAVREWQADLGDFFAPLQGGSRFSSPDVALALAQLEEAGGVGIGQSSWGPTGFAFFASASDSRRALALLRNGPDPLDFRECVGLNRGARVEIHPNNGGEFP